MKRLILLFVILLEISCGLPDTRQSAINTEDEQLNNLTPPVILIGKSESMGCIGITVRDKTGKIFTIGNLNPTANNIGSVSKVGDIIIPERKDDRNNQ